MKDPRKKIFFYGALAGFCAISLSVLFFFLLYKFPEIGDTLDNLSEILAPIIYGGVIAYLLRPICNWVLTLLQRWFPKLKPKTADTIAVALGVVFGLLIVYALIAILAPQLYYSIISIWETLPDKADQFLAFLRRKFHATCRSQNRPATLDNIRNAGGFHINEFLI